MLETFRCKFLKNCMKSVENHRSCNLRFLSRNRKVFYEIIRFLDFSSFQGVCDWPKGRVLGGTSVLNFMIHTKGHKYDYDYWSYLGNKGWSYEEVLPYFMKTENVKIPEFRNSRNRGKSGYLDVDHARFVSKLHKRWMNNHF